MRDRIVFFILGAVLATIAYFAGDISDSTAKQLSGEYHMLYTDSLMVGSEIMIGVSGTIEEMKGNPVAILSVLDGAASLTLSSAAEGMGANPHIQLKVAEDETGKWVAKILMLDDISHKDILTK